MTSISPSRESVNVASRLKAMAEAIPNAVAVAETLGYRPFSIGRRGRGFVKRGAPDRPRSPSGYWDGVLEHYRQLTFRELDQDSDQIAAGLCDLGVERGTRLALLVRPGIEFISLVFALFKAGAVVILMDPGMGRRNLVRCLAEARPEGLVAVPLAHAVRTLLRSRFPDARFNVTIGRRLFWGGVTLRQLRAGPHRAIGLTPTTAADPAAIIFTTGSTGPAKGVLFTHGTFDAQVEQIRDFYGIQPGEIDVPCFPMFGLFNCAMGVTAVIPDMDPSRPANVDPRKIVRVIEDWRATQTFGSPAVWNRVGRYCQEHGVRLSAVRRVLSAGAPIPVGVLQTMKACIDPEGDVHTPYGATEALPVASIAASEVLRQTAEQTAAGAGVCVGRNFPGITWKVIRIVDGPIATLEDAEELPAGHIGELIVRGPVVTAQYVTRTEANATGKIREADGVWHRMGDAGYLDDQGRFWYCGRVAHRVLKADGPMYPVRCEAVFNQHPDVFRSALVGVGTPGQQRPVLVVEPRKGRMPRSRAGRERLQSELRRIAQGNELTAGIDDFLLHPAFPVDIRHNAKIFREKLAVWAARNLHATR